MDITVKDNKPTVSERFTTWIGSPSSLIAHTIFFIVAFSLPLFGVTFDKVLLVLTTVVSLEAIYLAIFIQMTVNRNTASLHDVEESIDEIEEDIDKIEESIDEIEEDIEDIEEEISEEGSEEEKQEAATRKVLENIESNLQNLVRDIESLKKK